MLDKARKADWKVGVELAGIDPLSQASDDVGAAACGIASSAVRMLSPEPAKGAGSVEVVVQKRVDHDHRRAGRDLSVAARISPKEQVS